MKNLTTIYDVPSDKLIGNLKDEIKNLYNKNKLTPPEWVPFVKTGHHKQRPPEDPDWWYVRCASLLRRIYLNGPVGVSRLRSFYGGGKDRGSKESKFTKASGSVIRKAIMQLEKLGLLKVKEKEGRVISSKGQSLLDKVSNNVIKEIKEKYPKLGIY